MSSARHKRLYSEQTVSYVAILTMTYVPKVENDASDNKPDTRSIFPSLQLPLSKRPPGHIYSEKALPKLTTRVRRNFTGMFEESFSHATRETQDSCL